MGNPQLEIIAHRGASALALENTLAAFAAALDLGVGTIETDLRATRDGQLVLAHDADLARLTGQPRRIADSTLDELRAMTIGRDAHRCEQTIATPAELLDLVAGRARVLFDLKFDFAQLGPLFPLLRERGAEARTILGARSVDTLAAIKAAHPALRTPAFGRGIAESWALAEAGADIVRLWATWPNEETVARARQLGKPVWIMCGSPSRGDVGETTLTDLLTYRRDGFAGVILNDPRLALAANGMSDEQSLR
jgi:glycerophosphoryl diester phosphodiesterase